MNKTYWWRLSVLLVGCGIVLLGWIYDTYFCFATVEMNVCFLDKVRLSVIEPLFLLSLSLLAVSPFLFLVRDEVFKRWLRFAAVWFVVAAILAVITPTHSDGFGPSLNPTKESLSIWLGALFVLVSLVKLAWDSKKLVR